MTGRFSSRISVCVLTGSTLLSWTLIGCERPKDAPPPDTQPATTAPATATTTTPTTYPAGLSATSAPSDVVRILLKALEEQDRSNLKALADPKAALAAMRQLLVVQGLADNLQTEQAVEMTLDSWLHKYRLFEPGSATVISENLESGKEAFVRVRGKSASSETEYLLVIPLLRERGAWLIGPDLWFERQTAD